MSSDDEALPPLQQGSSDDEVDMDIKAAQDRLAAGHTAVGTKPGAKPTAEDAAAASALKEKLGDVPKGECRIPNPAAAPDDVTDEDEDEEEKPYGKKAVKKMMAAMEKDVSLDFAADLEADEDGYKPITWTQLSDSFSYERVAHGFKLHGDISQKDREHWERSKQIKLRDKDGREGAVFFYEEESKPYFDWEDVKVGSEMVVKSPRFHRFLDGQEGMRLEKNKAVAKVAKRRFTDVQRLDYGRMNKTNGNTKYTKKKYDDAIQCYETAINHLQGTFHEHPEFEQEARELTAQCYLNIAASQIGQGRHRVVDVACRSALRINASAALNAKAYFRIGQSALKLHELVNAKEALVKALELAPGDAAVIAEITKLNEAIAEDVRSQKELYDLKKKEGDKKFGLRRSVLQSEVSTTLDGVHNFRDVGGRITAYDNDEDDDATKDGGADDDVAITRVPRHMLFRAANLNEITKSGLRVLSEEFRVKTILDLRTQSEVKATKKRSEQRVATFNKENELEIALYKKSDGARGKQAQVLIDVESKFTPVTISCAADAPAKIAVGKSAAAAEEDPLAGPVVMRLDLSTRAVMSLASWWTLLQAVFWGILAFVYAPLLKVAARVMIQGTALRVGVEEFYQVTLQKQGPEIKHAMEVAAVEANYPILVHCSMGKDRTGIIVALLLAVSGVGDDDLAQEYAAVSGSAPPDAEWQPLGLDDNWRVAQPKTMVSLLKWIRATYGSVSGYLESIGVPAETQKRIRRNLSRKVPPKRK